MLQSDFAKMTIVRVWVFIGSVLLAVFSLLIVGSAQQSHPPALDQTPDSPKPLAPVNPAAVYPFPGEKLVLNASWGGRVLAGRLTLTATKETNGDSHPFIKLTTLAESAGPVRTFILAVDHHYSSFLDPTTLLPFRFEKSIREGDRKKQESVFLDQEKHVARIDDKVMEIPAATRDLTALLYAIRESDLTPGAITTFAGFDGASVFKVEAEASEKEIVKVSAGEFECVQLAVRESDDPEEGDQYRIRVWITDDSRRLPVRISASPSFGEVRVELKDVTPAVEPKKTEAVTEPETPKPVSPKKPPRGTLPIAAQANGLHLSHSRSRALVPLFAFHAPFDPPKASASVRR